MASQEQIYVVCIFCCFFCSWISFPCLYLYNNLLISIFILCAAKNLLCIIIWSISCLKFLSTSLSISKWKWKVLASELTSLLLSIRALIIIMTWLNCCKVFLWFYCANTLFVWFLFLVCFNYFQVLFFNIRSLINSLFGVKFLNFFSSPI